MTKPRPLHHMLLGVAALLALFPVFFMLVTSLRDGDDYAREALGFPWPPTFENFSEALKGGEFFTWLKNSVILTAGSVFVSTFAGALAAYAIAQMRFRGRDIFLLLNVSLMIVPPVVMLIPLFAEFSSLELVSTYRGVIAIYAGLTLPFSVYLLTTFFRSVPKELIEAALADGASHLRIFFQVMLPLSAPAFVTLIVVNSLWVWNELLIALVFLPEDELKTLMVGVTVFQSKYNLDVPVTMAGMLLACIPMVALYIAGQRYFIRGLTAGALKG